MSPSSLPPEFVFMLTALISRLRASVEKRFPERHIYIRTHGEVRGLILTPTRQLAFAIAAGAIGLWTSVSVVAMLMAMSTDPNGIHAQHARAYERLIADSRGRLAHEGVPVMANADAFEALTNVVEKRQETLVKLYASVTCHSDPVQGAAISPKTSAAMTPTARLRAVQANQDKLVGTLDSAAKPCADRVRQAIRVAGLNPDTYAPPIPAAAPTAPRAQSFTERVQRAFADMTTLQVLADAASSLPFNRPTNTAEESSGFGPRIDPITGEHSNHPGVDFPAPRMTAVFSTAPGVVSFTGVRPGYGNTVEIDHGRGVTTRFAHLAAFMVKAGEKVGLHQQIGGIGSTGHSTGPHLHYEVLVDGRPRNPEHFLKAGDYVRQTG